MEEGEEEEEEEGGDVSFSSDIRLICPRVPQSVGGRSSLNSRSFFDKKINKRNIDMKSEAPSVSTATAGAVASAGASAGAPLSPSSPSSPPKRQAARPMKSTIQVRGLGWKFAS